MEKCNKIFSRDSRVNFPPPIAEYNQSRGFDAGTRMSLNTRVTFLRDTLQYETAENPRLLRVIRVTAARFCYPHEDKGEDRCGSFTRDSSNSRNLLLIFRWQKTIDSASR